jgi:DNA-binding MarR family transcriptional regulator
MGAMNEPAPSQGSQATAAEPDDPRRRLVELAAAFASGYLRWLGAKPSDGLNFLRLRVLETLHCQGPQMMRALSDELGLTPRNMTALVDGLEGERLVRRVAHPTDRRATLIELTPQGDDAAEESLEPRLKQLGDLFDDLSTTEQKRLAATLEKLVAGLRQRSQRC